MANDTQPYGAWQTTICQKCVEKARREHDFEHRIVEDLKKKSLPSAIVGQVDEWATIRDLLRLMMGAH